MMNRAFNDTSVDSALETFMSKNLGSWTGLNPGTSLNDVSRFLNVDETWSGSATLGDVNRPFVWYLAKADNFREDVRVWMGEHSVFLIDTRNPGIVQTAEELVAIYGEPEAKLDTWLGSLFLKQSEWVFPEQGLTIFLNPRHMKILRLAVFPPVQLETYKSYLRLHLKSGNKA